MLGERKRFCERCTRPITLTYIQTAAGTQREHSICSKLFLSLFLSFNCQLTLGSDPRYQNLKHVFARCTSQKTYCLVRITRKTYNHARITRETRVLLP